MDSVRSGMDSREKRSVKIVEYNPAWKAFYYQYKKMIHTVLPDAKVELIGSAAIPMVGKKEIDILVICDDVEKAHSVLEKLAFGRGPITKEGGYLSDSRFGVEAEFHVVATGSKKIDNARRLIARLQSDKPLRDRLEFLKRSWDGLSREEYRKHKAEFLGSIQW